MTPIIPNPKEPWKVCEKQLADLDKWIKVKYPQAKLDTGVKYARWAVFDELISFFEIGDWKYNPDYIFKGIVFGKPQTILMWLPFFS
jgi:hypothetical protein